MVLPEKGEKCEYVRYPDITVALGGVIGSRVSFRSHGAYGTKACAKLYPKLWNRSV
jgi:hypothetical protein